MGQSGEKLAISVATAFSVGSRPVDLAVLHGDIQTDTYVTYLCDQCHIINVLTTTKSYILAINITLFNRDILQGRRASTSSPGKVR